MQYNDFIQRVQQRARLATPEEAARLTEIVLATLGERLYRTERDSLVAQLPTELNPMVYAQQSREDTRQDVQRFSVEEFYKRVSARVEVGYPEAKVHTKAVMATLQEAVSAGELRKALDALPDEYEELLQL